MAPNITRLLLGGFIGTLAMTAMMYLVAPMMGVRMDIAAMLGSLVGGGWAAGMAMHFINGTVVFPLVYGYLLVSRLPGPPTLRGVVWGVVLWLVAETLVMPMMGAGLFSATAGGMVAAGGSLVGHLLYGASLGAVSGSADVRLAHA
jgi:hypothetical protein